MNIQTSVREYYVESGASFYEAVEGALAMAKQEMGPVHFSFNSWFHAIVDQFDNADSIYQVFDREMRLHLNEARYRVFNENLKLMAQILQRIGYPRRGTPDETADIQAFADEIQKKWPLQELEELSK
jgi:hypothetical protein